MGKRYRIRVSGKARANPDPAMLAQIVILIGRRLRAEQLRQHADADRVNGNAEHAPEGEPDSGAVPDAE